VSLLVRRELIERARDFNIILDDVSITELSFGKEYTAAVEAKQLKDFLGGTRFGSDEELKKTVNTWLNELAAEEYNTGILKLVNRYDECLNVAQQEAQRAAFVVERAKQERQQKIVQAEGEAEAARMISFIANSQNRVFLSGSSLMLNINDSTFDDLSEKLKSKK
ncbi:hypothetical protein ANN_26821, partial [Periplaneta americana]